MSVRCSVVGRAGQVLVSSGNGTGNLEQVIDSILQRVQFDVDDRKSYTADGVTFHYIVSSKIIFLCAADDTFPVTQAFHFLQTLQNEWTRYYGARGASVSPAMATGDFGRRLAALMSNVAAPGSSTFGRSSSTPPVDKVELVNRQIDEVKKQMVANLDSVLARGERIETLVESTATLNTTSATFKKTATNLKRHMWWKNIKCWIIIGVILVIIAFVIALIICKGNFKTCGRKQESPPPHEAPHPSPSNPPTQPPAKSPVPPTPTTSPPTNPSPTPTSTTPHVAVPVTPSPAPLPAPAPAPQPVPVPVTPPPPKPSPVAPPPQNSPVPVPVVSPPPPIDPIAPPQPVPVPVPVPIAPTPVPVAPTPVPVAPVSPPPKATPPTAPPAKAPQVSPVSPPPVVPPVPISPPPKSTPIAPPPVATPTPVSVPSSPQPGTNPSAPASPPPPAVIPSGPVPNTPVPISPPPVFIVPPVPETPPVAAPVSVPVSSPVPETAPVPIAPPVNLYGYKTLECNTSATVHEQLVNDGTLCQQIPNSGTDLYIQVACASQVASYTFWKDNSCSLGRIDSGSQNSGACFDSNAGSALSSFQIYCPFD